MSWTTEDFRVYYHLVLNTMTFMGIIMFSFGNEKPTDLRQGKTYTFCRNFLPLYTMKIFLLCSWLGFFSLKWIWGLWKALDSQYRLEPSFFHTWTAGIAALWDHLLPTDLKGQTPATEGSDATFIAKASHSSPVFAAHAQTTASLGGHRHLVELPDLQMRTLKKSKKPEWWKITEEQCLVCSAWAITHSSSSDVLQEIKEPDSILFCLTESQYCLRSAGAKADFSTPF